MGAGAWLFMGIFWVALLALIIFLVARLLPSGSRGAAPAQDNPEEILDRRFARGEIDAETFQAQRSALGSDRGRR